MPQPYIPFKHTANYNLYYIKHIVNSQNAYN